MANLALIRGAANVAPKFTDIRGAVEPGIQTFKNIMSLRQEEADKLELEKKRQETLKANDYRSLGALQTDGIPKEWEGFFNEQALRIKTENKDLVNQRGQIDQFDYMDKLNNQQSAIAKLQNSVEAIKQYSAQYADLIENDDLTDSLTAEELKAINDIVELKGKPVYKNNEVYFVTEDGKEYAMSDLPKLKMKEAPIHLNITKGLESLIENGAQKGMFRNSKYLQDKVDTYLNNTKMTGDQAKSLAADFLGLMGKDGNFADVFKALTGGKLTDIDNDGDIDQNDYIKSISNIKSDDDFIKRVKSEYKEIALMGSDNLKDEYDRINKAKPIKPESLNKWEFDELTRRRELTATAAYLKPIKNFLSSKPISGTQAKLLIDYANTNVPGIEIYQNTQTDDDGKLLNPNAYVIEVNGKQKPFIIGQTSGSAIDKFIKDLYGCSATERLSMFDEEVDSNSDTSTTKETPQEEISNAGLNQPEMIKEPDMIKEGEYPEEYANLSEEPISAAEKRKIRDQRIIKRISKDYQGVFSERNIAEVEYDLYGRNKENEERQKNFINENKNISILENLKKEFEKASDNRLSEKTRNSFSIKEKKLIEEFIGKPIARITEKEFIQYKYNLSGGDLANLKEDKYSQYKEG